MSFHETSAGGKKGQDGARQRGVGAGRKRNRRIEMSKHGSIRLEWPVTTEFGDFRLIRDLTQSRSELSTARRSSAMWWGQYGDFTERGHGSFTVFPNGETELLFTNLDIVSVFFLELDSRPFVCEKINISVSGCLHGLESELPVLGETRSQQVPLQLCSVSVDIETLLFS